MTTTDALDQATELLEQYEDGDVDANVTIEALRQLADEAGVAVTDLLATAGATLSQPSSIALHRIV